MGDNGWRAYPVLKYLGGAHATNTGNTLSQFHFPNMLSYRFTLGRPSVTLAKFGKMAQREPTAK
jgi:hypothetical protein